LRKKKLTLDKKIFRTKMAVKIAIFFSLIKLI
jgi:hypothetical protein